VSETAHKKSSLKAAVVPQSIATTKFTKVRTAVADNDSNSPSQVNIVERRTIALRTEPSTVSSNTKPVNELYGRLGNSNLENKSLTSEVPNKSSLVQLGGPGHAKVINSEDGGIGGVTFGDKMDTFALPLSRPATTGKVFYEIQVEEMGKTAVSQFGWVTPRFNANGQDNTNTNSNARQNSKNRRKSSNNSSRKRCRNRPCTGVGGDDFSWAIDVRKSRTFHSGKVEQLDVPKWQPGDTVGCAADLTEGTIMFGHNGKWVTAFTDVDLAEGLVPAVSGKNKLNVSVNFGQD
jgi:hypothetical protein